MYPIYPKRNDNEQNDNNMLKPMQINATVTNFLKIIKISKQKIITEPNNIEELNCNNKIRKLITSNQLKLRTIKTIKRIRSEELTLD